jgi:solute carrier family 25, member 38
MPKSLANFLGGATSGCISTLLLQPLDVVKTRLQVSPRDFSLTTTHHVNAAAMSFPTGHALGPGERHPGIFATMRTIIRHDTPFGLWRGVTPTIIRNTLGVGAYFVTLNNLSTFLARPDGTLSDRSTLFVGAAARSISVTALCPLSVVKTRLELAEYSTVYSSMSDALRKIARAEGIKGLFSGLTPAIVRDAPYSALYLLLFLKGKEAMNSALGLTSNSSRIVQSSAAGRRTIAPSATNPDAGLSMSSSNGAASTAPLTITSPATVGNGLEGITTIAGASVVSQQSALAANSSTPTPKAEPKYAKQLGMAVNFTAGALGGGLATMLTQPQDVVKTRMQIYSRAGMSIGQDVSSRQYRTVTQTVRTVMREEGVYGFFRGAYPRFLKRILGSAITWMVYEEIVRVYDNVISERALLNAENDEEANSRIS